MVQVLTPSGYRDAATLAIGDEVCAFDLVTGAPIINLIESIAWVNYSEWVRWHTNADLPPFSFVKINGTWTLNSEQSIWRNGTNVCHAKHLVVGDTIYDDADNPVVITRIDPVEADGWWRFDISGDHSYIADGLILHNASRFWVLGTGTWDSSTTTHWAASSGAGSGGQSVPGSADTATFDGSSGGGTVTLNFGGTITIQTLTLGAFTGTWDNSANNNNITLSSTTGWSNNSTGTRTITLGSATYTLTSTSAAFTLWATNTTGLTLSAASAVVDFSGAVAFGSAQTFSGGSSQTYGTVKVSGARHDSGLLINTVGTISTLTNTAAAFISLAAAFTITTLTQSAQLTLIVPQNATTTITNAPTLTGTLGAPLSILNSAMASNSTTATISCTSGTFGGTYVVIAGITFSGGATFSFTNSFDLGKNTGVTITAPSAGSSSILVPLSLTGGFNG